MKLIIDTERRIIEKNGEIIDLYSDKAFEIVSEEWLKLGWNQKYIYTFSWMGRPIIQLPEDMLRIQEVIYNVKPDIIIETGIAHGGSLIYYASLLKAMGKKSRVIGMDIEIRPHNRKAIEEHELYEYITMIEGSSTEIDVVEQVKSKIKEDEKVLIILDSCHTKEHVLDELKLYSQLVSKDSYIVATDGSMKILCNTPRSGENWEFDNPVEAVKEFLRENYDFVLETPNWTFNESSLNKNITHWPSAWLKKVK